MDPSPPAPADDLPTTALAARRRPGCSRRRWVAGLAVVAATLSMVAVWRDSAGSAAGESAPAAGVRSGAATPPAPAAAPGAAPRGRGHVLLALGDSVPAGTACGCDPFPETYGALLSRRPGAPATVDNRAVSGLDTAGLLAQLGQQDTADAVRRADVLLVTIGANDFGDHHDDVTSGRCEAGDADCVADELATLRTNLTAVLARIRALRTDHGTTVLVTGYWNVFEDGDVARRAVGEAGLQASLDLTRRANAVIANVSRSAGARYVDLFRPFELGGRDVTALMAADGDHPSAAGHALIARTLLDAGLPGAR